MTATVINLALYRAGAGLRTKDTALLWRGLRHDLAGPGLVSFVEAIYQSNIDGLPRRSVGFRIRCDRRTMTLTGWDMGPMVLVRGKEVTQLGIRLLAAERLRVGREGPVSA